MPVAVVTDYPRAHRVRRLRRWITTFVGGLLVFVGVIASIGLFPAFVYFALIVAGDSKTVLEFLHEWPLALGLIGIDASAWIKYTPGSHAEVGVAAAILTAITIV